MSPELKVTKVFANCLQNISLFCGRRAGSSSPYLQDSLPVFFHSTAELAHANLRAKENLSKISILKQLQKLIGRA
jgi:hypothetical protein